MTASSDTSARPAYFRALAGLMWLALPISGLLYAVAWNQLPERVATHFNFDNQPNGWISRETSLVFSLVFTTLVTASAKWTLSRVKKPEPTAWALLLLFYVIVASLLWAEESIIAYNTERRPVNVVPLLTAVIVSAVLVAIIALSTRRGTQLLATTLVADETHASGTQALILALPAGAGIAGLTLIPIPGVRVAIGIGAAVMFAGAAVAWDGFHYLFSPAGVEIRTLGFRLRSIPAADIQSYAVDRWSALGGYGIRGVGDKRAYVWSNKGVRIQTSEGEVFLGHQDPEKLIHDLDLVTRGREKKF